MKYYDPVHKFDQGGSTLGEMQETPIGDYVLREDLEGKAAQLARKWREEAAVASDKAKAEKDRIRAYFQGIANRLDVCAAELEEAFGINQEKP